MAKTKEQTEVAIVAPSKKVELIIPEEIEIGGLKISNTIIKEKIAEVKKMTIEGVEDKKGYDAAVKAKGECVKLRTQSEAWRKEKVKPVNDALTKLKTLTDGFGVEAKVGEEYLAGIIDPIDEAKLKIKKEKAEAKQKKVNERIAKLVEFGGKPDPNGNYSFEYDAGLAINTLQLNDFEDDEWNDFVVEMEDAHKAEQARVAKEKKDQADAAAETAKQIKINTDKQIALRLKELKIEGFVANDLMDTYTCGEVEITAWEIANLPDESWEDKISRASAAPVEDEDEELGVPGPSPERIIPSGYSGGSISVRSAPESFDIEDDEITKQEFEVPLTFTTESPFIQFNVGPTFVMRIFPAVSEDQVMASVDPEFATLGAVNEDLRFALIKQVK